MAFQIKTYASEHEELVKDFNARMEGAGSRWNFYDTSHPDWVPPGESETVRRDYYVALDDTNAVRGAFCLKPQKFYLRGEAITLASIQGPVSEGLIDPRYSLLAFLLVRDMEQRESNIFGWGASDRVLTLLNRLGWVEHRMPVLMRICHAGRYLRHTTFLRTDRFRRLGFDLLAFSGLGALGVGLGQLAQKIVNGGLAIQPLEAVECDRYGGWADEIWEAARHKYLLIAQRDQHTMNALLPAHGWPEAKILRMTRGGRIVGWAAVRDTQFAGDFRFGDLRVGSVIDSLALPGEEAGVIKCATDHLERSGVDLVFSTYTHPIWTAAFRANGFLVGRGRRPFLVNPALADAFGDADEVMAGMHFTPLDGDGPRAL